MELVVYLVFFTNDVPLWYTNSKKEVQTINHNYICISLLQRTDINVVINSYLNPDKLNTQSVYIHLFTFLQRVLVVPSSHHEVEKQAHK